MLEAEVGHASARRGEARPFLGAIGTADDLSEGDPVVHPVHGLGRFEAREAHVIDGSRLELLRLNFADRRLTLRVPVAKVERNGLRRPMAQETVAQVMEVIAGRPRPGRGSWVRRSIELTARLNSGDPLAVAEVVRDLGRNSDRPDQPYGEQLLFAQAVERLAGEIAAVECSTKEMVASRICATLRAGRAA